MNVKGRPRTSHPDRPATHAERQRALRGAREAALRRLRRQLAAQGYYRGLRHAWESPQAVFAEYDAEFHFTLDVCATRATAKCARFFSPDDHGLVQDWGDDVCWMHPPYGDYGHQIAAWMEKAYRSSLAGATVVCLVPARTGTRWWQGWVKGKAEVRERQGRMTCVGAPHPAGFDVVAVIYRPSPSSEPHGPR
jgi:phage N-6-adenine-methyltransferase